MLNFEIALNRQNFCVSPSFFVEMLSCSSPSEKRFRRDAVWLDSQQDLLHHEGQRERERERGMDARCEAAERNRYAERQSRGER